MTVTDEKGAATRERIIEVARALFLKSGYDGTGMKAIAKEVGISTPALYWHFPSKEEIYHASMEAALWQFLNRVREEVTASEPVERMRQLVRAHVTYQLERSDVADAFQPSFGLRAALQTLPDEARERIVGAQRGYLDEIRAVLREGQEEGAFEFDNLTVTAFGLITLCEYPNAWYDPAGSLAPAEIADLYIDLALKMVGYSKPAG